jgi:hypothetical protein
MITSTPTRQSAPQLVVTPGASLHVQLSGQADVLAEIRADGVLSDAQRKGMAVEAKNLIQRWFRDRNTRNAHTQPAGGRRSHYWRAAAQSTSWRVEGEHIDIAVAKEGVGLHLKGGSVRPVNAKALAIPARAEAYGRLPADFAGQLHVVIYKRSNKAALVGDGKTLPRLPIFWLLKHVRLNPDPSVLPPENVTIHAMLARLDSMRTRSVSSVPL